MRRALGLEYLGTHYQGWQRQKEVMTVQECVEKALSQMADEPINTVCAGRTDAGVHASGQVIHFDTQVVRQDIAWVFGVNAYLPKDISIRWMQEVPDHFSARFSAVSRRYRYIIDNSRTRSALYHDRVSWYCSPLDAQRMHQAAQYLLGEHDFSAFRGTDCQSKSPVRHVHSCEVKRIGNQIEIEIEANAFLQHMVRNIVGSLLQVGKGNREPEWIAKVLSSCDRRQAGVMAKPEGLYLIKVNYPEEFGIDNHLF